METIYSSEEILGDLAGQFQDWKEERKCYIGNPGNQCIQSVSGVINLSSTVSETERQFSL